MTAAPLIRRFFRGDDVLSDDREASWLPFDLLGHPVPANKGAKARPQHAPTAENLEKLVLLYGMGKSDAACASAIGVSIPTMKKYYFASPELQRVRRNAQLYLEGELLARLNRQSLDGNTSATEKLFKRLDKARLGEVAPAPAKPKRRKGLKDERREAAYEAGQNTDWADLLPPPAGSA